MFTWGGGGNDVIMEWVSWNQMGVFTLRGRQWQWHKIIYISFLPLPLPSPNGSPNVATPLTVNTPISLHTTYSWRKQNKVAVAVAVAQCERALKMLLSNLFELFALRGGGYIKKLLLYHCTLMPPCHIPKFWGIKAKITTKVALYDPPIIKFKGKAISHYNE